MLGWLLRLGVAAGTLVAGPAFAADEKQDAKKKSEGETFDQDSVLKDAEEFFGKSTEGLAKVIEKALKELGRPNAYVKGEEASGAITVGLRYGNGTLVVKNGGVGINYQQRNNVILAPIRLGVGLRAGASIGYMHYTPKKTYNPF